VPTVVAGEQVSVDSLLRVTTAPRKMREVCADEFHCTAEPLHGLQGAQRGPIERSDMAGAPPLRRPTEVTVAR
jgi:hypothetical protein